MVSHQSLGGGLNQNKLLVEVIVNFLCFPEETFSGNYFLNLRMKNSDDGKNSKHQKPESDEISLKNFTREKYHKNESPDNELAEEKSRLLPGNETK